jgi:hypothetical protein
MHSRTLASLVVALLVTILLAGCGGGDAADSSTPVDQLLDETFSGGKTIKSGRLDVSLDAESGSGQPVALKVAGPFINQKAGRLPQLDLDASFTGGGQTIEAGVTATADSAFVSYGGNTYEIAGPVFQQFKAGYEEAAKQPSGQQDQSLATLGIDPRRWLTNAENAGEAKVGDTDTIKITGGVDVNKLLDDVNTALDKARSLGVEGSDQLPEKLTDQQKQQAADAIKDLSVEIYTGKEDTTLRRMLVNMGVQADEGGQQTSGTLTLDFQLLDLNEDQSIEAPSGAKPFDELLGQLGGLGLGGAGSTGSGSSGSGTGGASAEDLKKYSDCVTESGSDTAKAQKCAELLSP